MASDRPLSTLMNVVLFSKTGYGKSSLANALTQTNEFEVSNLQASITKKCKCVVRNTKEYSLAVVDTPGAMDTKNPVAALFELCTAITMCPDGFNVILLVLRLDDKFTEEARIAVKLLGDMFGAEVYKYCIIVFTHGDHIDNNEQKFRNRLIDSRMNLPALDETLTMCDNRAYMIDVGEKANETLKLQQVETLISAIFHLSKRHMSSLTGKYFTNAKEYLDQETKKGQTNEVSVAKASERLVQDVKKDGKACFPSGAMVQTPDGPIPINLLSVGQSVLCSYNNKLVYSPVYMWGHRDETACSNSFVTITTVSAQLTLSSDHLLPITDEMGDEVSVPAGDVCSGNTVQVLHHMHDKSQEIRSEKVLSVERGVNRTGLFAPFTMCGTVIVDDVVASCYIRCLPHAVSHALLWPVRFGWRFSPSAVSFCNELGSDGMCWWVRVISNRVLPMVKWLGVGSEGKIWLMSVISNRALLNGEDNSS